MVARAIAELQQTIHGMTTQEEVFHRLGALEAAVTGLTGDTARIAALELTVASQQAESTALRQQQTILMQFHQALHQELRDRSNPSTNRLVDMKSMIPEKFGKADGMTWRTWSYTAKDYISNASETLKDVLTSVEPFKEPITWET